MCGGGGGISSIFEVGCGSGANLFFYEQQGIRTGGIDYSESLIEVAKKVLHSQELIYDEAKSLSTEKKYDAVFSNSVFSYFESEDYAREVLKKMCCKAKKSIGLIDIHDVQKKEAFKNYRKKIDADYEKRYKDLPKLFYSKNFFCDFAKENNLEIDFATSDVEGYWNNEFVFSCYMYKR